MKQFKIAEQLLQNLQEFLVFEAQNSQHICNVRHVDPNKSGLSLQIVYLNITVITDYTNYKVMNETF
jgi:hypothetical protein